MALIADGLPIHDVIADIRGVLAAHTGLVIQAPPGAGKTTGVPLAILNDDWLQGRKIVMLEPRRLAARSSAMRMAQNLGQEIGDTVGYRVRFDAKVGPKTRIEVVTEGILTRMIQDDPGLDGIGAVIFDEIHERNLQGDLGLALCLETQSALRDDLRIIAMSATMDAAPIAQLLGDATVVTSEGRAFGVETHYLGKPDPRRFIDGVVDGIVCAFKASGEGDVLVFLPGQGEIKRVQTALETRLDAPVSALFGDMAQEDQDRSLRPLAAGRRRIILSTAIAETSLTIEGVRVVVDAGLMRAPRYDPVTGMSRLETVAVSRASADQRRGRAGRLGPGHCFRLWSEAEDRALAPRNQPEILVSDLSPLMLELAQWGIRDAGQLRWLDQPPQAAQADAKTLLGALGAIDAAGGVTPHGKALARLGVHPRLAHMMVKAKDLSLRGLACDLAALLNERDIFKASRSANGWGSRDADIRLRIDALRSGQGLDARHGLNLDRGAVFRVRDAAKQWRRRMGLGPSQEQGHAKDSGVLLAFAYPDRIAKRRSGAEPRYVLAQGGGAAFTDPEPLSAEEWLIIPELDGDRRDAKVFMAAPLTWAEIDAHFSADMVERDHVGWDKREQAVTAVRQTRLGQLILAEKRLPKPDPAAVVQAMVEGVRQMGLGCLPWNAELEVLRQRVAFVRRHCPDVSLPDLTDAALLEELASWAAPYLEGLTRRAHLERMELKPALMGLLDWDQRQVLDQLAPTHVVVPTGNRHPLEYSGDAPVLAVRLQEMFGCADGPKVAGGKVPVLLHLLSPGRRPLQITSDLAGFWASSYHGVKSEMKGQYPRHWWPDDPLQAEPTARAKPRK